MTWYAIDTWIVVTGALCAIACALPGCFLQLRKMSMMGDAISHAVLPGLAIAFLITGSRTSLTMFIGASIVGVLTAIFTQWISDWGKVDHGASMGIVFTSLFALGLLLIVQAADNVDLDPGCVLYGAIELTPLDIITSFTLGSTLIEIPRASVVLTAIVFINLGLIALFYKELKLSAFDPDLSTTLGIRASYMHYLLMTMIAVTTVAAFEAVGSIIVIAMLIVPSATAYLLTDKLRNMLIISSIIGIIASIGGHIMALTIPNLFGYTSTSTSGMIATFCGILFAIVWVFAPEKGLVAQKFRRIDNTPFEEPI